MFRGTRGSIVEVFPLSLATHRKADAGRYKWRKVGPNGRIVCTSDDTFAERRYAALSGHREFPLLKVLHRYGPTRMAREADDFNAAV